MAGLRIAADHTSELLILSTHITGTKGDGLVLSPESKTEVMSGVHGLAWVPSSEGVLREILQWCGFPHARVKYTNYKTKWYPRIEIVAAREESTFSYYDKFHVKATSSSKDWIRRIFKRN